MAPATICFAEAISASASPDASAPDRGDGVGDVHAPDPGGAHRRRRLVEDPAIPVRAITALTRANIYFAEQLAGMSRGELLMYKGIGRKCLADIEAYLSQQGISLLDEPHRAGSPDEWSGRFHAPALAA